jgi:hypothetical protein
VPHLLDHLVSDERRQLRTALGSTGWAQAPLLARERHQGLLGTARAANPSEARVPDAAVEVAGHHVIPATTPEAVTGLEALLPDTLHGVEERLEQLEQRRLARISRLVDGERHGALAGRAACPLADSRRKSPRPSEMGRNPPGASRATAAPRLSSALGSATLRTPQLPQDVRLRRRQAAMAPQARD